MFTSSKRCTVGHSGLGTAEGLVLGLSQHVRLELRAQEIAREMFVIVSGGGEKGAVRMMSMTLVNLKSSL